jgi:hypothetical protein
MVFVLGHTYSDSDILGSSKEPIDQDTHERRVETELHGQISQFSVGHTLRHDNRSHGNTCSNIISFGLLEIV